MRCMYRFESQKLVSTNQWPSKSFKGNIQKKSGWVKIFCAQETLKAIFQSSRPQTVEKFVKKQSKGGGFVVS